MYGRLQEEITWTRLLDAQREVENRRRFGPAGETVTVRLMRSIGEFLWTAAGVVVRSRRRLQARVDAGEAVRDVA